MGKKKKKNRAIEKILNILFSTIRSVIYAGGKSYSIYHSNNLSN